MDVLIQIAQLLAYVLTAAAQAASLALAVRRWRRKE